MGTVTFLMPFNYIQDEISINLKAIFPQIKKKKIWRLSLWPPYTCLFKKYKQTTDTER